MIVRWRACGWRTPRQILLRADRVDQIERAAQVRRLVHNRSPTMPLDTSPVDDLDLDLDDEEPEDRRRRLIGEIPDEDILDPERCAEHLLQIGAESAEAGDELPEIGLERVDDPGDYLCHWDAGQEVWQRTTLSGVWRHPSWPEDVVIYDHSTLEPSWELADWMEAEDDIPAGYVSRTPTLDGEPRPRACIFSR